MTAAHVSQTYACPRGLPVPLGRYNPPGGFTIFNNSALPADVVWISESANGGQGQGHRLGAFGTFKWTDPRIVPYAVLDQASTSTSVNVAVLPYIDNPESPVDIGIAVANALFASGVPSVLIATPIAALSGQLQTISSFPPTGQPRLDVSQYSTLHLVVTSMLQANVITLLWSDVANPTAVQITTQYLTGDALAALFSEPYAWEIPIKGKYLVIANGGLAGPFTIITTGTNQPNQGKIRNLAYGAIPRTLQTPASTFAVGVSVQFTGANGDGAPDYSQMNGPVDAYISTSLNTMQYLLEGRYINPSGASQSFFQAPLTGTGRVTINHPPLPIKWFYSPLTVTGAGNFARLTLIETS